MRFYGLIELERAEAVELYATRTEAESALAEALIDEPEWEGLLAIVPIDLGTSSLN